MAHTVRTYSSAEKLSDAIGVSVIAGLDDSTVGDNYSVNDQLLSFGGTYTIIKNPAANFTILTRGAYYVVINSNA